MLDASLDSASDPELLCRLTEPQRRRLTDLLDGYLRGLEAGEPLDAEELLRANDDIREELEEYFGKLAAVFGIAHGLRPPKVSAVSDGTVPQKIGEFRIEREIGRGGMGVVYAAVQETLGRRVAIKVLAAAALDGRRVARFRNEAAAAGILRHPNIVPVYCVGEHQGLHYYAMPLIEGRSMDVWIDERAAAGHNDSPPTPRARRVGSEEPWRTPVEWTVQLADALHAAHECGVVHRDVKPSNLMLDDSGRVWITDFGLARRVADCSLTATGDIVGTLRYMSPEQAAGSPNVDARTDVYSLAATLYELLTLTPAAGGPDNLHLLQHIRDAEPPRLRARLPSAPADLDTVLRKAMANRKEDRYESAALFGDDLRAVLAGSTISARPPQPLQRIVRWLAKRRRVATAAAATTAVALLWLIVSGSLIVRRGWEARSNAQRAERYLLAAHAAVDSLGSRVADQLAAVPGAERVRHAILLRSLEYYERFAAEAEENPAFAAELAATQSRLGGLTKELRSPEEALHHYRRAAAGFAALDRGAVANVETTRAAARNFDQLAIAAAEVGLRAEAAEAFVQAIGLQSRLAEARPQDFEAVKGLAMIRSNYGSFLAASETPQSRAAAETLIRQAVDELTKLLEMEPRSASASRGLSAALSNLGGLLLTEDALEAVRLIERAIDLRLAAMTDAPDRLRTSAEVASLYEQLGGANFQLKAMHGAAAAYGTACELRRRLRSIAPDVPGYARELAGCLCNLSAAQLESADYDAARRSANEALALLEAVSADRRGRRELLISAAAKHNLAHCLSARGDLAAARERFIATVRDERDASRLSSGGPEAARRLADHFAGLLRCEVNLGLWEDAVKTAEAYRRCGTHDPSIASQAAEDAAEAAARASDDRIRNQLLRAATPAKTSNRTSSQKSTAGSSAETSREDVDTGLGWSVARR